MIDILEPGESFAFCKLPEGDIIISVIMPDLFPSGRLLTTPGAEEALKEANVSLLDLLSRHLKGDWGDLDADDKRMNNEAVKSGEDRIFSSYDLPESSQRIWIITEADRSGTTALLPDEY